MLTVRFNDVEEYLSELDYQCRRYSDPTDNEAIRLTRSYRTTGGPTTRLSVKSSFRGYACLVTLEYHCGELWNMSDSAQPAIDKAHAAFAAIAEAAARHNLTIRPGYVEVMP